MLTPPAQMTAEEKKEQKRVRERERYRQKKEMAERQAQEEASIQQESSQQMMQENGPVQQQNDQVEQPRHVPAITATLAASGRLHSVGDQKDPTSNPAPVPPEQPHPPSSSGQSDTVDNRKRQASNPVLGEPQAKRTQQGVGNAAGYTVLAQPQGAQVQGSASSGLPLTIVPALTPEVAQVFRNAVMSGAVAAFVEIIGDANQKKTVLALPLADQEDGPKRLHAIKSENPPRPLSGIIEASGCFVHRITSTEAWFSWAVKKVLTNAFHEATTHGTVFGEALMTGPVGAPKNKPFYNRSLAAQKHMYHEAMKKIWTFSAQKNVAILPPGPPVVQPAPRQPATASSSHPATQSPTVPNPSPVIRPATASSSPPTTAIQAMTLSASSQPLPALSDVDQASANLRSRSNSPKKSKTLPQYQPQPGNTSQHPAQPTQQPTAPQPAAPARESPPSPGSTRRYLRFSTLTWFLVPSGTPAPGQPVQKHHNLGGMELAGRSARKAWAEFCDVLVARNGGNKHVSVPKNFSFCDWLSVEENMENLEKARVNRGLFCPYIKGMEIA
ncbi:hypothetical protein QBC41DRAFT_298637 [Cercophora samala]|uniref:Uncharacterized protein n=1 Tax=Cercophora samala TaxID=330535 RepID=A0AA39ZLQ8_9PEZI|nr:hypothetical protein QBC41DRAFT_298637 [Cercophora samala]